MTNHILCENVGFKKKMPTILDEWYNLSIKWTENGSHNQRREWRVDHFGPAQLQCSSLAKAIFGRWELPTHPVLSTGQSQWRPEGFWRPHWLWSSYSKSSFNSKGSLYFPPGQFQEVIRTPGGDADRFYSSLNWMEEANKYLTLPQEKSHSFHHLHKIASSLIISFHMCVVKVMYLDCKLSLNGTFSQR